MILLEREHAFAFLSFIWVYKRFQVSATQKKSTEEKYILCFLPAFSSLFADLLGRIWRGFLYSIVISWTRLDMVVRFRRTHKRKKEIKKKCGKGGVSVARLEMFYTDFSADLMTSWSIESCVCCVQQHTHWTRRLLVYHFLLKRSFGMKSKEGLELEMLFKILKAFRRILLALRTF